MRLLVLGATGGTGRHIVAQGLEAGHEVTVFARDGGKVAEQPRPRVVIGSLLDAAALAGAMRGQDVVVSAVGRGASFTSEQLIARTVPAVIAAMQSAGVRRLVFTSALGVGDSLADTPLMARLFIRMMLRDVYADKQVGDQLIANSDLEWTIVRPSKLTDGPLTRRYRHGEHLSLLGMPSVSRADVAHFLLQAATDPRTIHQTLLISA